ncbi:MAG: hypothetical protein AB8C84_00700 [Oligoflexales bacterium]
MTFSCNKTIQFLKVSLLSSLIILPLYSAPRNSHHTRISNSDSEIVSISIQTPREIQTPFTEDNEPSQRLTSSRVGQHIQLSLNSLAFLLQHLEVLNIYNCERWWCGGTPALYLGASAINYALLFREHPVMIPTLLTAALGAGSLLFWDVEYWNISTRHRTEYYDTHNFYDNALWLNQFWSIVYLYLLKPHFQAQEENHQQLSPLEIEQLQLLLHQNQSS